MNAFKQRLGQAYTVYGVLMFFIILITLFPLFWIVLTIKSLDKYGYTLSKLWSSALHWSIGMPVKKILKGKFDNNQQYIFAPNHSSYLDITAVGSGPFGMTFLGKVELAKAPIFGYVYKRFNITVDRKKPRSRKLALEECYTKLDEGKSLTIFPEGSISRKAPELLPFKNGAFLMAIEKQVPIVPVTIPFNWYILNGDGKFVMKWHRIRVIYHEPISTIGLTKEDVPQLKEQVQTIIEQELALQLKDEKINQKARFKTA